MLKQRRSCRTLPGQSPTINNSSASGASTWRSPLAGEFVQEMRSQEWHVVAVLRQRRQNDAADAQPVEQILAEASAPDQIREVAVDWK